MPLTLKSDVILDIGPGLHSDSFRLNQTHSDSFILIEPHGDALEGYLGK